MPIERYVNVCGLGVKALAERNVRAAALGKHNAIETLQSRAKGHPGHLDSPLLGPKQVPLVVEIREDCHHGVDISRDQLCVRLVHVAGFHGLLELKEDKQAPADKVIGDVDSVGYGNIAGASQG